MNIGLYSVTKELDLLIPFNSVTHRFKKEEGEMKKATSSLFLFALLSLGVFPSSALSATEPFIGEMMMTAASVCPRGWADANGQMLTIAQNQALFSLLGTTYGGDGRTTFGLFANRPAALADSRLLVRKTSEAQTTRKVNGNPRPRVM
jgi:hypothetical protein